jgi:hypothetical protein
MVSGQRQSISMQLLNCLVPYWKMEGEAAGGKMLDRERLAAIAHRRACWLPPGTPVA